MWMIIVLEYLFCDNQLDSVCLFLIQLLVVFNSDKYWLKLPKLLFRMWFNRTASCLEGRS